MVIPNMIPVIQSVCLSVLIAQNKHRFRSIVYLIIAMINVVGTWLALQSFGIIGAAFVTGATQIIGQVMLNWYYQRKSGLHIIKFWKEIVRLLFIPIVLAAITIYISRYINFNNLNNLVVGIFTYSLLFIGLNWLFIMNDYERHLVRSFFRLYKHKS